ncbi:MAG: LysM peptidoglycan-binding domain-containing protein [Acidimicrobiales bacterium]|nr:LysM peptidoglycan-binding domain-containing protein [Acidimicrobiales bacterium]
MRWFAFLIIVPLLLTSACGGSSDEDPVVVQTTTSGIFSDTTLAAMDEEVPATTTTEAVYQAPTTTTTAAPAAAAPSTSEPLVEVPQSVTVEAGDSLSKIAKRFGTAVDTLVRINGLCDANQIFVGQVILLDDPEADEVTEADGALIVTVMAGDSLSKIAKRHDTTVEEIMVRNAIEDANLLFVGQELVIDGEAPSSDEPEDNPNC